MKLALEQANALLAMEPFMIVYAWYRAATDEDSDDQELYVSIAATNINVEHCMDELVKYLQETVTNSIEIPVGESRILCHMHFVESGMEAAYSHDDFLGAYETDPYWEIENYELISTEAIETVVEGDL